MDSLDTALEQATEAAKMEAEAHLLEAEAEKERAESLVEDMEQMEEKEEHAAETAVEIARIEAEKDIKVAEIAAEVASHDNGICCSECMHKFEEHQASMHTLETRIATLEQRHEASKREVERIHVGKREEAKKKPEKKPKGFLYL